MSKVLAFDVGASNGRAMLASLENGQISLEEIYRFDNVPEIVDGRMYWNIKKIFSEILEGIFMCYKKGHNDISSLGIDTWGVDHVLTDDFGNPVSKVYHYRDKRTDDIENVIDDKIGLKSLYMRTGIQNIFFNTSYQLIAMASQEPDILLSSKRLFLIPDYLNFLLTGKTLSEYTVASTTQLMDPDSGDWDRSLIKALSLPENIFTPITYPGKLIGTLKAEIMTTHKLPGIPVIATASHDTSAAICAIPSYSGNYAFISCGTWSIAGITLEDPIINEKTYKLGFSNEGSAEGKVNFLKNVMGLWILQEIRRIWSTDRSGLTYPDMEIMAGSAEPLEQFINVEDDMFKSPDNMINAIKRYCLITGQKIPTNDGQVVRCVLESLALKYRSVFDEIEDLTDMAIDKIHIVGGGVNNKLLCRLSANALRKHLICGPAEGTSLGNAIIQFTANKFISSTSEGRKVISNSIKAEHYYPDQDSSDWEKAYIRYKHVICM